MSERRQFTVGRVIATRAGVVGVPADCRAGRRLCVVVHKVVTEGVNRIGLVRASAQ